MCDEFWNLPVIEHNSLSVGADPLYWLIMPWECAVGAGMFSLMALWNFLRLGSTVTTGDTATPCPSSLAVNSGSIGCACTNQTILRPVCTTKLVVKLNGCKTYRKKATKQARKFRKVEGEDNTKQGSQPEKKKKKVRNMTFESAWAMRAQ